MNARNDSRARVQYKSQLGSVLLYSYIGDAHCCVGQMSTRLDTSSCFIWPSFVKFAVHLAWLEVHTSPQWFGQVTYRKIPKISPGAYIFQRSFLGGLLWEGLIFGGAYIRGGGGGGEICVSKSAGLIIGGKFVSAIFPWAVNKKFVTT